MDIRKETITPALAQAYLEKNKSNRSLRESHVQRLVSDMKEGRWQLTHQGIAFNNAGDLVDGQHRLHAVINSGACVEMFVARGVEADSAIGLLVDVGAARSAADVLGLPRHITDPCSFLQKVAEGGRGKSKASLKRYADAFGETAEWLHAFAPSRKKGITSATVKAAAIIQCYLDGSIQNSAEVLSRVARLDFAKMTPIEHAFIRAIHSGAVVPAKQYDTFAKALALFDPSAVSVTKIYNSAKRYEAARQRIISIVQGAA